MKASPDWITELKPRQVFVFGSNTEGIHGGGAAYIALNKFGAIYGQSEGLQGQSYAIVTKDLQKGMRSVDLKYIEEQISKLLIFAYEHPELEFLVTKIGCELAGFKEIEIADCFSDKVIPENVLLPQSFIDHLENKNGSNN